MAVNYTMAPMKLTVTQTEWIENESLRTGNPKTTIIRNLIQEKVDSSNIREAISAARKRRK